VPPHSWAKITGWCFNKIITINRFFTTSKNTRSKRYFKRQRNEFLCVFGNFLFLQKTDLLQPAHGAICPQETSVKVSSCCLYSNKNQPK